MKARIRRIFNHAKQPLDAIVITNSTEPHLDMTFFYATGVPAGLFEGSVAILEPNGASTILTSPLEAESARSAPESEVVVFDTQETFRKELERALRGTQRIGLNNRELTYSAYLSLKKNLPGRKFADVSEAVGRARTIKDREEISRIREAARIASQVAKEIPGLLKVGMTELELASEMEYRMGRYGASGPSFKTIVAFGPHGAQPHFEPTRTRLKKNTTMVCDFGAFYARYASDVTRSFAFGRPPKEAREIHETVEAAQQAAFDMIRPGVVASEVHNAADRVIQASQWKGRFIHGLGHSIGLAVHDPGFGMGPRSKDTLEAGMCVTVEPGIYVPGFGGVRIEDDVLITPKGFEMLSKAPRGYLEA